MIPLSLESASVAGLEDILNIKDGHNLELVSLSWRGRPKPLVIHLIFTC